MRTIQVVAFMLAGLIPTLAFAQDHVAESNRFSRAVAAKGAAWVAAGGATRLQQPPPHKSWVARHPALFGALLGSAVAGGTAYATYESDIPPGFDSGPVPSLPNRRGATILGAGVGAGVGAAIGAVIGLLRD